jgi:3-deoxy-D-manno-octulosonic-acid transferase
MQIFYLVFVKIVEFLLPIISSLSPNSKLSAFTKGRKKPYPALPAKTSKRYWFHCASLGEFEQARPVIERLKHEDKACSIVITFFSPSGFTQRHNYALADAVIYLPLDTPSNAKKLLDYMQPDLAVFVKYEIWYFHLDALFKRKIPVYLISATFRSKQFLFSFAGKWLFRLLPQFRTIFLQDEKSHALLKSVGLKNIILSGDTRYDRVKQNALQVKENELIRQFKAGKKLLMLGSSWPAEEDILLEFLEQNTDDSFKVIIAPHDISQSHIDNINKKFEKYRPTTYTAPDNLDSRIMVLNTMGHLASAYFYADIAFIGGAFGKGLHNILEPLAFGVPVVFGPHFDKYPEASKAMEHEVAISISDVKTFTNAFTVFSDNKFVEKSIDFINWNSGATDVVVKAIQANLGK